LLQPYRKLFPEGEKPKAAERPQPDWEVVHRELARKGVTLKLLWQEYREKYPDGYGRSQFCEHYGRWNRARRACANDKIKFCVV
jgi:transposase